MLNFFPAAVKREIVPLVMQNNLGRLLELHGTLFNTLSRTAVQHTTEACSLFWWALVLVVAIRMVSILLRGTIVNRTHGTHKNLYV